MAALFIEKTLIHNIIHRCTALESHMARGELVLTSELACTETQLCQAQPPLDCTASRPTLSTVASSMCCGHLVSDPLQRGPAS